MNKWRKIEDLLIYSGKGITPKYVEESSIIVLNQKCIRNHKIDYTFSRFTNDTKIINPDKFIQKGDILFNSTGQGTAGRCAFVDWLPENKKVITDSHILILRIENYFEAQCLSYSFHSIEKEIMSFMDGSTGQGELDKIRVFNLLTSLSEKPKTQKQIAEVLSDFDSKIEVNNKINTELEAMAKTLYDYWFVQFDFPDKNGKPYKSSGGKMVFNEALKREIPVGWEDGLAKDLFQFNPTLSIKKGSISSYIDMNALPVNGFMTKPLQKKAFSGGMKFQNDDVVMARITPCLENGKTALISLLEDEEIGFGSTEFIVIRGIKFNLKSFICCLSRSDKFRKHSISKMTGTSGRKRVKADELANYKMPIPSEEILLNFEKQTSCFFDKMTLNTKENQKLSELRDWLLPMLMNGQVTMQE